MMSNLDKSVKVLEIVVLMGVYSTNNLDQLMLDFLEI